MKLEWNVIDNEANLIFQGGGTGETVYKFKAGDKVRIKAIPEPGFYN
ncbi:MAG TPA: hypothetical protein GX707_01705 [Epulopiscium sp.]|nr:hypothetical protein [Candidatus Epulonipiscium sp.]